MQTLYVTKPLRQLSCSGKWQNGHSELYSHLNCFLQTDFNISLEESGIVVESGTEDGVAKGMEAFTLLDNPNTRNTFIDELNEVCMYFNEFVQPVPCSHSVPLFWSFVWASCSIKELHALHYYPRFPWIIMQSMQREKTVIYWGQWKSPMNELHWHLFQGYSRTLEMYRYLSMFFLCKQFRHLSFCGRILYRMIPNLCNFGLTQLKQIITSLKCMPNVAFWWERKHDEIKVGEE